LERLASKAKHLLRSVEQIESYVDSTHSYHLKLLNPIAISLILKETDFLNSGEFEGIPILE